MPEKIRDGLMYLICPCIFRRPIILNDKELEYCFWLSIYGTCHMSPRRVG